jgi:hypothetical protein
MSAFTKRIFFRLVDQRSATMAARKSVVSLTSDVAASVGSGTNRKLSVRYLSA